MATNSVLAIILILLLVTIAKKQGLRIFISLVLNFSFLFLAVYFTASGFPALPVFLVMSVLASSVNLFYINGTNHKTKTAFWGSLVTVLLLACVAWFQVNASQIQGFGSEEIEELSIFSFTIGVRFADLTTAVILISTLGAMNDTAVAVTSYMAEYREKMVEFSAKEWMYEGLHLGQEILGTTMNTLFFAFLASYLGLVLWFKDLGYRFLTLINAKVFQMELTTLFYSAVGVLLVIPISAWLMQRQLTKEEQKSNVL